MRNALAARDWLEVEAPREMMGLPALPAKKDWAEKWQQAYGGDYLDGERLYVARTMWLREGADTRDIARHLGVHEAIVYNAVCAR